VTPYFAWLRHGQPTGDEWHQIWLEHPAQEPGLTQAQSSLTYTSRGLDPRWARLAGRRGIITGVGSNSRVRGEGKGATSGLVRGWNDQLPHSGSFPDVVLNSLTHLPRGKQRQLAMLTVRQGQSDFRQRLLVAYHRRCAISGCDVEQVLQAAHIEPYDGPATNVTSNGLLLRADLHDLFDAELLWIDSDYRVRIATQLDAGHYGELNGRKLSLPDNPAAHPDPAALLARQPPAVAAA
jgi:hypothetical protein